jgi:hypothetical protein
MSARFFFNSAFKNVLKGVLHSRKAYEIFFIATHKYNSQFMQE